MTIPDLSGLDCFKINFFSLVHSGAALRSFLLTGCFLLSYFLPLRSIVAEELRNEDFNWSASGQGNKEISDTLSPAIPAESVSMQDTAYPGQTTPDWRRPASDYGVKQPLERTPPLETSKPTYGNYGSAIGSVIINAMTTRNYSRILQKCRLFPKLPIQPKFELNTKKLTKSRVYSTENEAIARVSGRLRGACIMEVGYYERGQLVENIIFPFDDDPTSQSFTVKVRIKAPGELRAITADGREAIFSLAQLPAEQITEYGW